MDTYIFTIFLYRSFFAAKRELFTKVNSKLIRRITRIYSVAYITHIIYKRYIIEANTMSMPNDNYSNIFFSIWIVLLFL